MAAAYKSIYVTFEANTKKLGEALKNIDSEATSVNTNLREINKGLKLDPGNTDLLGKKFSTLSDGIANTESRLKMLEKAKKQADEQLSKTPAGTDKYKDLKAQIESLNKEIERSGTRLANFQREIRNTAAELTDKLKKAVSDLKTEFEGVWSAVKKSEAALAAFTAASAKTGMNFEAAMSTVAATLNINQASVEYGKLSAAAKEMGETTSYSASEAALALNALAQAGYTADESIERLPKTLTLAKAGGLDLASAAKIVTNSMAALGLEEDQLDKFLDEMARTAQRSNTNIAELGEAVKSVGGTMSMAGQSAETMFTELGMLANAGITASESATHLRNIMLSLVKTDVQKSLKEMGVEVVDRTGEIRDLCDIMTDLNNAVGSMASGELIETFGSLFNVRDLASINALLGGTAGEMQALRIEIENSQGAAQQMSDTMGDNLKGDLTILKSAVEGLEIAVSEHLDPSLRGAAQNASRLVGELSDSVKNGELAETFTEFSESLTNLINNGLTTAADVLPTIIKFLTFIAENLNTILGVYTAIAVQAKAKAVITAVASLTKGVAELKNAVKAASSAAEVFKAAFSASRVGAVITALSGLIGVITGLVVRYKASLSDVTKGFSDETAKAVSSAEALTKSLKASREAREESISSIKDEYGSYQKLADSVYEMAEQEELSAGQKKLLISQIDQLNEKIPGLNLKYDESSQKLSKQREETRQLIDATMEWYRVQAAQENMTSVGKDIAEGEFEKAKLEERRREIESSLNRYYQTMRYYAGQEMGTVMVGYTEAQRASEGLREELAALDGQIAEIDGQLEQSNEELERWKSFIEDSTTAHTEALEAGKALGSGISELTEKQNTNTAASARQTKAAEELTKQTTSCRSELTNLLGVLDQVNNGTAYSTSQILDLIEKYPELAGAIRMTADGYMLEAEAVDALTRAKAREMELSARQQLAELKLKAVGARIGAALTGDDSAIDSIEEQIARAEQLVSAYSRISEDIQNGRYFQGSSGSPNSSAVSSPAGSGYTTEKEDATDYWKQEAEEQAAALEHAYKMDEISAEEYYARLEELNKRYYEGRQEYLNEYRKYAEKVHDGLSKLEQEQFSNAKNLEERLKAVREEQEKLRNAESQQVEVYSSAAGFHGEKNTSAIEKAQAALEDKELSLAETLMKLGTWNGESLSDKLRGIDLSSLKAMLPDLSRLTLPAANTVNNSTVNSDNSMQSKEYNITYSPQITVTSEVSTDSLERLRTEMKKVFDELMDKLLTEADSERITGF